MEPTLAVITMFAANFAPQGWAKCEGQLLQIAQNQALFALLGTTFGGNGQTNFALPDLRNRTPMCTGQGPGLSNRTLGQQTGTQNATLIPNNLPAHSHTGSISVASTSNPAALDEADGAIFATGGINHFGPMAQASSTMGDVSATVSNTGGSQPFNIRQPYLAVTFIIALQGLFPSQN